MSVLKCYICGDLFHKPRILPCGHTFCSDCLLTLRNEVSTEFKKKDKTACRRGESGILTCPHPDCGYSMRIMNLRRWALKNKAAADAVWMIKKRSHERKDITTQTNLQLGTQSLSVPGVILQVARHPQPEINEQSTVECIADSVLRTELLRKSNLSLDTKVKSWRSLATLVGLSMFGEMFSFK